VERNQKENKERIMRIKISYIGDLDEKLDNEIRGAMSTIQCDMYATGYNFKREERDLLFIKKDKPVNKENKI